MECLEASPNDKLELTVVPGYRWKKKTLTWMRRLGGRSLSGFCIVQIGGTPNGSTCSTRLPLEKKDPHVDETPNGLTRWTFALRLLYCIDRKNSKWIDLLDACTQGSILYVMVYHSERQPDKGTVGTLLKYLFADWWSKGKFPFAEFLQQILRFHPRTRRVTNYEYRLFSVLVREHRDMNILHSRICRITNHESRLFFGACQHREMNMLHSSTCRITNHVEPAVCQEPDNRDMLAIRVLRTQTYI